MSLGLTLLILFFVGRYVGRLAWSKWFGMVAYQILSMRSRMDGKYAPLGFYIDKNGFYSIRDESDPTEWSPGEIR